MPRHKKNKKTVKEITPGKKKREFIKFTPPLFALILIIFAGVVLCRAIFMSDHFTVDSTRISWHDDAGLVSGYKYDKLLETGKNENIFKMDIRSIAGKISSRHREFKKLALIRKFPNELLLDIHARQGVAQIAHNRFYVVDTEAILLTEPRKAAFKDLPLITGLTWRPSNKVGKKLYSPRLFKALTLLGAIKDSGILTEYSVDRINVSDHRNLVFYIDQDLEIKIGRERFPERLALLEETLSSSYVNKEDLRYIDLRFDDIVFGTK